MNEARYDVFGYRFAFRTNEPKAAELIDKLYSGCRDGSEVESPRVYELMRLDGSGGEWDWTVRWPNSDTLRKPSLPDCLYLVETVVCNTVMRQSHGLHGIHGAVVYGPTGDIVISGVSGAGKTTLSLALSARGMRVGGDDSALLDSSSGLVTPIPRCFHLDERSIDMLAGEGVRFPEDALRHEFVAPADLGVIHPPPARIRFIFLLEEERLASPKLVPQTQAQMAAALLMQTGRGEFTDMEGVRAMAGLTGGCHCYRVRSGELAATADAVVELMTAARA